MTIRTLTVREDEEGLYIRFKECDDYLILRPSTITGEKAGIHKRGDKVKVEHWNKPMGYFMLRQWSVLEGGHALWQGPRYDSQSYSWVYDA